MNTILLIIAGIVVLLVLWLVWAYNSFVRGRNRVDESWSDIDVQLKRRYDLIPNLVESVKGYMNHEKDTLQKVTEARNMAMNATTMLERAKAENMLTDTLKSLFAVAESYPDLKASQNFLQLQDEISDTENKIQAARRFYNSNVRDFNINIQTVPANTLANLFHFQVRDFFEINDSKERENVKVGF